MFRRGVYTTSTERPPQRDGVLAILFWVFLCCYLVLVFVLVQPVSRTRIDAGDHQGCPWFALSQAESHPRTVLE